PYGQVISDSALRDLEHLALIGGRYRVVLDQTDGRDDLACRLGVFVNAPAIPQNLDLGGAAAGVDLRPDGLRLEPADGLQSGQPLTVHWTSHNQGQQPTHGDFSERLIIRRVGSGEIVLQAELPWREAELGPLAAGSSR
ncbi:hypothetical protein, partial [Parachitinimonas caeni]